MRNKILWILILAVAGFGLAIQTGSNHVVHSQGRGGALTPEVIAQRNAREKELQSIAVVERKLMVPMRDGKRILFGFPYPPLSLYVATVGKIRMLSQRLAKAAEAAEKERDSLAARLANPSFVERAKPEAVEKARADHAASRGQRRTTASGSLTSRVPAGSSRPSCASG